ncbi:RNA polymerase sigma-70 factor [Kribbella jejuensis]|uniref:RNA polymerase ECF family sigma subunit n=1 Tax=Kribbella jejuensis TaxID=236068 RepID=A0A542DV12_9ACTN|nr:RNA polymerase sigma factor SigJ [Kribbella jejuensis]TQJ06908.1 RNA polymerase ECF family sigma subunit [Kribbella jejuensis]
MDDFERLRGRLFGIAYRMTGTATDAEEILQDAWLRWQDVDRATVRDPDAYLARIVTNLAIKQLTSARARRETYVGQWLPEPVLTGQFDALGPLEVVAERESVSFALLLMLERLSPAERAAYVLHEAFAYGYREVAELIGTSEANARQLASRAGKKLAGDKPAAEPRREQPVDREGWRKLVERFVAAARLGKIEELEELLAADVQTRADSGGRVSAARNVVTGRNKVARYLAGAMQRFGGAVEAYLTEANGEPALVAAAPEGVVAIAFIALGPDGVTRIEFVMNPEKLAFATGQLSQIGGLSDLSW